MVSKYKELRTAICVLLFVLTNPAQGSPENDRVYQLETVGWLRASDNADGIFGDFLDEQFRSYFQKQPRFGIKELKNLNTILDPTATGYTELTKQPEILRKVAQKYKIENILRTRVYKENDSYRTTIEWLNAPKAEVLSSVEFRYTDPGNEEGLAKSEFPLALEKGLDDLIQKLPFLGQITGIEGTTLTVSVGRNQNVKPKDLLAIYTLQSVKKHPLLKTIEEWRWEPVGRAQVEQVEESLSFAKVVETEPGKSVIRNQKIREIIPAPATPNSETSEVKKDIPRAGWVALNIGVGTYSREVGLPSTSGRTGGGILEAFEIESQIWLNSRFVAQGTLGGSLFKYSAKDLATNADLGTSYSGSGNQLRLAGGYSLFPMKTVFDSIAWVSAGIKTTQYSLPAQAADFTGDARITSFFVGLGGQAKITPLISAQLAIDLGLLRSASQTTPAFGDATASSDIGFSVAGTYRLDEQFFLRLLLKLNSQSMEFPAGESVSQKMFSITPSLMYYF